MVQITKFVTVTVIAALVLALGIMSPVTQPVSAAIAVLFDTGHQTGASPTRNSHPRESWAYCETPLVMSWFVMSV